MLLSSLRVESTRINRIRCRINKHTKNCPFPFSSAVLLATSGSAALDEYRQSTKAALSECGQSNANRGLLLKSSLKSRS